MAEPAVSYKILVVDDEEQACFDMKRILTLLGFVVQFSECMEAGLQKIKNFQPDCVLLDLRMPGMNGLEGLKRIKQNYPDLKVLMVAAQVLPEIEKGCLDLGAEMFISKPVMYKRLAEQINKILEPSYKSKTGEVQQEKQHCSQTLVEHCDIFPPEIYQKIKTALEGVNPVQDLKTIACSCPERDRLLELISHPMFGNHSPSTLEQWVDDTSPGQVADWLLAIHIPQSFRNSWIKKEDWDLFWYHSVTTAWFTREIALLINHPESDHWFLAGLLHDIGNRVMQREEPTMSQKIHDLARQENLPLKNAEFNLTGFTHQEVALHWLNLWEFPADIASVVNNHHRPWEEKQNPVSAKILYVADGLASRIAPEGWANADPIEIFPSVQMELKLKQQDLEPLFKKSETEIESLVPLFL